MITIKEAKKQLNAWLRAYAPEMKNNGMTYKQIGECLGVSKKRAKAIVRKGRKCLMATYSIAGRTITPEATREEILRNIEYWESINKKIQNGGVKIKGNTVIDGYDY